MYYKSLLLSLYIKLPVVYTVIVSTKPKPKAKNIFIVILWAVMILFSVFIYRQTHILATYTQTSYKTVSSYNSPEGSTTYKINATYTASNGKTYPANFTTRSNYTIFIYYNPSNPAVYKISGPRAPTAFAIIPAGVAALFTFLVYSNITFTPNGKKNA